MSYGLALFGLITEANFFVVFIALILVFFLLGLILGNVFSRPGKSFKETRKNTDEAQNTKKKPQQTDVLGQDKQENTENQDEGQNQQQRNSRYRYYNWW